MTNLIRNAAVALTIAGGFAGSAMAQQAAPAAPAAEAAAPSATSAKYSDDQVKKFADALNRVQKVTAEYQPKIAAATGPASDTLKGEMATKMHESLTGAGITPQDYSAIAADVNADADLRRRVGVELGALADAGAAPAGAPAAPTGGN
ncbi:DUF4168 domain-containing protein [Phenylobacterium sp.]|jgi:hypothetical protein|uniref:DUF4168 domain-containing protein n=1 Tax=Phenylobacterium sp. TaxID=1871053 RepID=UPI003782DC42